MVGFRVDNRAVVDIVNCLYSHEPHLMHLLRLLVFFAATYDFWFEAPTLPAAKTPWPMPYPVIIYLCSFCRDQARWTPIYWPYQSH